MTDPIADLRRHLLEAAERDVQRPRRFALPHLNLGPVLVFAVTAAACVAALVGIATVFSGGADPERLAGPQEAEIKAPAHPDICVTGDGDPQRVLGPVPDALLERFAVLRRAASPDDAFELPPQMSQIGGTYENGIRRARSDGGRDYHVVAAAVISRRDIARDPALPADKANPCSDGGRAASPGLCLFTADDRGHLAACYTHKEIESADGFLDISRPGRLLFAGIAPDGVKQAELVSTGQRFDVIENVYVGIAESDDPQALKGGDAKVLFDGAGTPVEECGKPAIRGSVPDVVRDQFAVFEQRQSTTGRWPASAQVKRFYEDGARRLGEVGDVTIHAIAAEIRGAAALKRTEPLCEKIEQLPAAPGVCLLAAVQAAKDTDFACWTVEELRGKPFMLEIGDHIAGIAPDDVRSVELRRPGASSELIVTDNFFAAPYPGARMTPRYLR